MKIREFIFGQHASHFDVLAVGVLVSLWKLPLIPWICLAVVLALVSTFGEPDAS